jgi:AcrR family transcriptional regulator
MSSTIESVSEYHLGLSHVILVGMPAQVAFPIESSRTDGLRERKKAKTRLAVEDAALTLFEERGFDATTVEEIAAWAEISTTTFFRYFPTKADVLVGDHGQQLPALRQAIVERPASESDLVAIWRAVRSEWVAAVDAERTARKARIIATSDLLTGLSHHGGERWLAVFIDALAQRRGLDPQDERCSLAARVGLAALASAVEGWIAEGCVSDLGSRIDANFEQMSETCRELAGTRHRRPRSG